jgi:hypothetical protein
MMEDGQWQENPKQKQKQTYQVALPVDSYRQVA